MKPVNSRCHAGWPDFKLPEFQPARRARGCPGVLSPQGSQEERGLLGLPRRRVVTGHLYR